ncbi:unnamed protein product, partial [Amoebophrya sp. A25]
FISGAELAFPTVGESFRFTSVYESLLILQMLSRLALEPRYKRLLMGERGSDVVPTSLHGDNLVRTLLGCVATAVYPEAREAAAVLANMCWMGDVRCEQLVCWLKFDAGSNLACDASG